MTITKVSLNTPYLTLYLEDKQGMVFHHIQQSLFQLPALSVSFFLAIDAGLSEHESKSQVAELSQLSVDVLDDTYGEVAALFSKHRDKLNYLDGRYPEITETKKSIPLLDDRYMTYQVAESRFAIFSDSDELLKEITQLLNPIYKSFTIVDFEILVSHKNDLFSIYVNGLLVEEGLFFNQVIPEIIDRLQILSFQSSDYYYCFHGAALQNKYGKLLLPAKSGSGKSTLSAALSSQGYALYSDEMVVLNKDFSLMALNLPIAVKTGSWLVLQNDFPELETLTIWQRTDGRELKYVWPATIAEKNIEAVEDNKFSIVNPNFISDDLDSNQPSKMPLSIIDSILIFSQSGYQLGMELTEKKLEELISFIERSSRHQIYYKNTEQALKELNNLWAL